MRFARLANKEILIRFSLFSLSVWIWYTLNCFVPFLRQPMRLLKLCWLTCYSRSLAESTTSGQFVSRWFLWQMRQILPMSPYCILNKTLCSSYISCSFVIMLKYFEIEVLYYCEKSTLFDTVQMTDVDSLGCVRVWLVCNKLVYSEYFLDLNININLHYSKT